MTLTELLKTGALKMRREAWAIFVTPQWIAHDTARSPDTRSDGWPLYFYEGNQKDYSSDIPWIPMIEDLMADDWKAIETKGWTGDARAKI